jgi:hypothetical protein
MIVSVPESFGRVGRTGNQLFQVAATIGLAMRHRATPYIFDDWPYRHVFSIPNEWYGPRASAHDRQPGLVFADELLEAQHLAPWVRSYLQDIHLWSDGDVWPHLRFSGAATRQIGRAPFTIVAAPGRVVGMHVRRGDNVTNEPGTINLLPESYYREALGIVGDYDGLVIVTDDPAWCQDTFADLAPSVLRGKPRSKEQDPAYFTEPALDWVDLGVLASCDRVICSNSTFAWWGAWLSADLSPVYPSYWVGHRLEERGQDPTLIFPRSWRRVETRGVCELTHHGDRIVGEWHGGNGDPITLTIP